MKHFTKVITLALSLAMVIGSCAACKKEEAAEAVAVNNAIIGDWTLASVNGTSRNDFAKAQGVNVAFIASNLSISSGSIKTTNIGGSQEYECQGTDNGVVAVADGEVAFTLVFDEGKKELTMNENVGGQQANVVFKKGSFDFNKITGGNDAASSSGNAAASKKKSGAMKPSAKNAKYSALGEYYFVEFYVFDESDWDDDYWVEGEWEECEFCWDPEDADFWDDWDDEDWDEDWDDDDFDDDDDDGDDFDDDGDDGDDFDDGDDGDDGDYDDGGDDYDDGGFDDFDE